VPHEPPWDMQYDGAVGSAAKPFNAHCYHIGTTTIKHPVPDRVKPPFVIFDIWALWRSALSIRVPRCQKLQMTASSGPAQNAL